MSSLFPVSNSPRVRAIASKSVRQPSFKHAKKVAKTPLQQFVNHEFEDQVFVITRAIGVFDSVSTPGLIARFECLDEKGTYHNSSFFLGSKVNKYAGHHSKILGITQAQLKDRHAVSEALKQLVGNCLAYVWADGYIRPSQFSKVLPLVTLLERVNNEDVEDSEETD